MPKPASSVPANLRPFTFHGVFFDDFGESTGQANGACPFCGREGKFFVAVDSGKWDCKVCGEAGNHYGFIRLLHKRSFEATKADEYDSLAENRGLLYPDTLMHWGLAKSIITGEWLVPGFNPEGNLNQVYRYSKVYERMDGNFKMVLKATAELPHQLFGVQNFDPSKAKVNLHEGPWDGMAAWETLRYGKRNDEGGLDRTGNPETSLYAETNVLGAPGCNVFHESWGQLVKDKDLTLFYDSDHPKEQDGKKLPPAGYVGMQHVCKVLSKAEAKPKSVSYLHWGDDGYNPDLKSGYDFRDTLVAAGSVESDRLANLAELLSNHVRPIPHEWIGVSKNGHVSKAGSVEIRATTCRDWKTLQTSWKKAMKWIDGLDLAFSVMLATVISTDVDGDQLWTMIMSPPSGGKSTLCEALSVAKEWIFANSTMTGIHSGWKTDRKGEEDHSLVPKIKGKTLVIKDGDTLLQSANRDKTLAELRDIYDRTSRVHYAHGVSRAYEDINLTIILCGTPSLRQLDTSELGERFLKCKIMDKIDTEMEDDINWRAVNKVRTVMGKGHSTKGGHDDTAMVEAKQLTGGYVDYLRKNAHDLLSNVEMDDEAARLCTSLGKFVAYMRARPSTKQEEDVQRELSTRLVSQHARLAYCLAAVMGKTSIDAEVLARVVRVALDTAAGRTLDLTHRIAAGGLDGAVLGDLAGAIGEPDELKVRRLLTFLRRIEAVEAFKATSTNKYVKIGTPTRYRLSPAMADLYRTVRKTQSMEIR